MKLRSMGERYVGQLLTERNLSYSHDVEFNWSLWKRYDFLLHDYRILIEIFGQHHYTDSATYNTTAAQIQQTDALKKRLAEEHTYQYIALDYRQNDLEKLQQDFFDKVMPLIEKYNKPI